MFRDENKIQYRYYQTLIKYRRTSISNSKTLNNMFREYMMGSRKSKIEGSVQILLYLHFWLCALSMKLSTDHLSVLARTLNDTLDYDNTYNTAYIYVRPYTYIYDTLFISIFYLFTNISINVGHRMRTHFTHVACHAEYSFFSSTLSFFVDKRLQYMLRYPYIFYPDYDAPNTNTPQQIHLRTQFNMTV